jgi:hypothetical protein
VGRAQLNLQHKERRGVQFAALLAASRRISTCESGFRSNLRLARFVRLDSR